MDNKMELEEFKQIVEKFVNDYNLENLYINIENIEPEICACDKEHTSYKKVTISIDF